MKLIIEDDEGKKTVVPFSRDEITIGREEGNTIRLTERNVSRRHARLLRHNGHIMVEDLGSYNGIRLNGDRVVGQVQVQEGDLIQIGDYDLAVQRDGVDAPLATPAFNGSATQPLFNADGSPVNGVPTQPLPRDLPTVPALSTVADPGETLPLDESDEAHAAAREALLPEAHRRQSTSIIRVDNVEQNRLREILDIEPEHAPRLVLLNTEFKGREFSLLRTELKVGRTDENDIAIDHRSLSRTHCKIVRESDGEWRVIDLQSANGLLVNGETYGQAALKHRDVLELGHVQLQFVAPGQTMPGDTSEDDGPPTRKQSVTRPLSAITLGLLLAGGAAYFMLRGKDEQQSPMAEASAEAKASAEASVQKGRDKIKNLEWKEATEILAQAFVGSELHPEAVKLLADIKREGPFKDALDKADGFLKKDELSKAKEQLDLASTTVLLKQRHEDLTHQWTTASEEVAAANPTRDSEPSTVAPAKTAAAQVRAPEENPNAEMLTQLADDARVFIRQAAKLGRPDDFRPGSPEFRELKGLYAQAKTALDKCIKVDKTYADCHKLLAGVLGNMGDGEGGAREYSRFLELAPNHPQAAKVRELLEDYRRKQANH